MNRANTMQESHSIACAMQVVTIKTSLVSNAQLEVAERTDLRCSLPKLREVRQALARLRWQSCGNYPHIRPARGAPQPHTVFSVPVTSRWAGRKNEAARGTCPCHPGTLFRSGVSSVSARRNAQLWRGPEDT